MCTQTQIPQISPLTNNWRKRRTEHRFYAAILTDITTRNTEYINKVTQIIRSENLVRCSSTWPTLTLCF
jgi:hypothetical protein